MGPSFLRPLWVWVASLMILVWPAAWLAQSGWRYVPNKVGHWRPWRADRIDSKEYRLTHQEVDLFLQKLKKLSEVFRKAPVFNPPVGIEVQPSGNILY